MMYRSLLFVPSVTKMLQKIPSFTADSFIVDLEDSISEDNKEEALDSLVSFLSTNHRNIFVRLDRNHMYEELRALKSLGIEGLMLPKFEDPSDFDDYIPYLECLKIIALIETPLGAVNTDKIAACRWVDALALGAEDYTASIGMKSTPEFLMQVRSRLIMYGRAYDKCIYDTPSFETKDMGKLECEVKLSRDMGFDGKLAINPKQIDPINRLFVSYDYDKLQYLIDEYEKAGKAVVMIDGMPYEKMHIKRFKKIITERIR